MRFYRIRKIQIIDRRGVVREWEEKEYVPVSWREEAILRAIARTEKWKEKYPEGPTPWNVDDFLRRYTHICNVGWDVKSDWYKGYQFCDGVWPTIEEIEKKEYAKLENGKFELLLFYEE